MPITQKAYIKMLSIIAINKASINFAINLGIIAECGLLCVETVINI